LILEEADPWWTVNPFTHAVVHAGDDGLGLVDVLTLSRQTVTLPRLADPLIKAYPNVNDTVFLGLTLHEQDAVTDRLDVHCFDGASGKMLLQDALCTFGVLKIVWSKAAGAFLIFDRFHQCLWSWSPEDAAMKSVYTSRKDEPALRDVTLQEAGSLLVLDLLDEEADQGFILVGCFDDSGLLWEDPVALPSFSSGFLQVHPAYPLLASETQRDGFPGVQILNLKGCPLTQCELPRDWVTLNAAWSSKGTELYLLGDKYILSWAF